MKLHILCTAPYLWVINICCDFDNVEVLSFRYKREMVFRYLAAHFTCVIHRTIFLRAFKVKVYMHTQSFE